MLVDKFSRFSTRVAPKVVQSHHQDVAELQWIFEQLSLCQLVEIKFRLCNSFHAGCGTVRDLRLGITILCFPSPLLPHVGKVGAEGRDRAEMPFRKVISYPAFAYNK